ncbi:hemolysin family protein [Rhodohalobacter barkolensis]|uniref:HlyC/CorC family transporter n=1 Tax=Rhodohalobacter barkolensis TaxID=2053187 RepID=A0A2N0VH96_9BACT|nr:hemolysin family protein [Rhodohalobacter barkolensis]PKD43560.1 HlyC/CorC family transporter [Rhodohalobacter barkolensis]
MPEFIIITITILLSGFFSGSEMAFVSANRLKLEIESRKNTLTGRSLAYFSEKPEIFLTTTLVGNNIVNVLYATLMAIFLVEPVNRIYNSLFEYEPSVGMVLFIQTMIASVIILLFGEILSKAIFRIQADFMVKVIAVPLRIMNFILRPLIILSNSSSGILVKWLKVGNERSEKIFRRQDVEMIFKELRDSGGSEYIDQDDSEILHNVLELSNKRVRDTMVPRTEIVAIDRNSSIEDLKNLFITSGYSKIPVYQDNIDDVIGVVFAYDLFNNPENIGDILRPVKLIPSSKKSKDLLQEFRQSNVSVAIVIDEYGGTAGMVTIEDLIEEVVGDIQDEYDKTDEVIKKIADNTYVVSGNVELDELEEKYPEIELQDIEDEFETLAGYIISHVGRIPKVNEEILIQGNIFIISKATQSRIETVKIIYGSTA